MREYIIFYVQLIATLVEVRDVCDAGLQKNRDEKKEQNLVMPGTQMEKIVTTNGDVPSEEKRHKLYYIHYEGMDRRMDEWVERERCVFFLLSLKMFFLFRYFIQKTILYFRAAFL